MPRFEEIPNGEDSNAMNLGGRNEVPKATVARMALYLRELQELELSGAIRIKSKALGDRLGFSDAQVRRDLSIFGQFGKRGFGYEIAQLIEALRQILGTDRVWGTILIGMGNLGRALAGYRGFGKQNFPIDAIFESDPTKIGIRVDGILVRPIDELESTLRDNPARLAILAVPADSAQEIADRLAAAGVQGILNFAPTKLRPKSDSISIVNVDMAIEMQRLAFAVVNNSESG